MKVTTAQYLDGSPALDEYHISIAPGISLNVSAIEYIQLVNSIGLKVGEDAKAIQLRYDKFIANADKFNQFIQDMRNVFYEELGESLWRREVKDIDMAEFDRVLASADSILGLE